MGDLTEFERRASEQDKLFNARWADPGHIAKRYAYEDGDIFFGRHPHNPNLAIGETDDRHVFVGADTRSGKDRSLLINNQCIWPGSLISIGPKGEEATITAARRGDGNEDCDGMGQEVYVLDPFLCADVPDQYRAYYDPLSELDPEDGNIYSDVAEIATAITQMSQGGDAQDWSENGRDYIALVIVHVLTFKFYRKKDRHLITARDLVTQGNVNGAERIYEDMLRKAELLGEDTTKIKRPDPFEVLLREMLNNPGARGYVQRQAHNIKEQRVEHSRYYVSVRTSAARLMNWMEGEGIENTLVKGANGVGYENSFDIADLKTKKISVYLHLPERKYDMQNQWLRGMIVLFFQKLGAAQLDAKNEHRVLMVVNEFANLGKMEPIGTAINSIAGAGVKLMICTQRVGDLKGLYGEAWEKFSSSAAQIWFGVNESATKRHLEEMLGKTQVIQYARSVSTNSSEAIAQTETEGYSHTNSQSTSRGETTGDSLAIGKSNSRSRSKQRSRGKQRNTGSNKGTAANRNYGPGIFFHGWQHSLGHAENYGTNESEGDNSSTSDGLTRGVTDSNTRTTSKSLTNTSQVSYSETQNRSTSRSNTQTEGRSATVQEQFQTKPLLSTWEIEEQLSRIDDREHPAYPGLALVKMPGQLPFFVRRSNHDEDPFFVRKFRPNPAFDFIPFEEQKLMGWQITPAHFHLVRIPPRLARHNLNVEVHADLEVNDEVRRGEPLLDCFGKGLAQELPSPIDCKIIDILDDGDDDACALIRAQTVEPPEWGGQFG